MYKIKVVHISFVTGMDVTETMICKYLVLVQHQKLFPKWTYIVVILTNVQKVKLW